MMLNLFSAFVPEGAVGTDLTPQFQPQTQGANQGSNGFHWFALSYDPACVEPTTYQFGVDTLPLGH